MDIILISLKDIPYCIFPDTFIDPEVCKFFSPIESLK